MPIEVATYLDPGARETLTLSRPIPEGYVPVVVYPPVRGMRFAIVSRTEDSLTVENVGTKPGFVAIYFASERSMRTVAIAAPMIARLFARAVAPIARRFRS